MSQADLEPVAHDHRRPAADWHAGQISPLYAYASTGTMVRGLLGEIDDSLAIVERGGLSADTDAVAEHARLLALHRHVEVEVTMLDAREIGREHGQSAAAWWQQDVLGGRATGDRTAAARRVLDGINDSDPAILDALPGPDEGYTTAELEDDLGWEEPDLDDRNAHARWQAARPALWDAYLDALNDTVTEAVAEACRSELTSVPTTAETRLDAIGHRAAQPVHSGLGL